MSFGSALILFAVLADWMGFGAAGFGANQVTMAALGLGIVLLSSRSRRTADNTLLALCSGLLALGALEVAVRVILGPEWAMTYELHPRYLHRLIPNSHRLFRNAEINGGEVISVEINADGFRGDPIDKAAVRPRIIVYGDSFIEAPFVRDEISFPGQLRASFLRYGQDVEVINAGVVGYGPDQAVARMVEEVPWLKPDLVILSLFAGNDFGDLLRNHIVVPAPGGFEWVEPTIAPEMYAEFRSARYMPVLYKIWARWRRATPRLVPPKDWAIQELAWAAEAFEHYSDNPTGPTRQVLIDRPDWDILLEPTSPSAALKRNLMAAVLDKAAALGEREDVPVLILIIPHTGHLTGSHGGVLVGPKTQDFSPQGPTDQLAVLVSQASLPALNLGPIFGALDPGVLYLKDDDHWNAGAQKLAAEDMVEWIMSEEEFSVSLGLSSRPNYEASGTRRDPDERVR